MTKRVQRGTVGRPHPGWVRMLALLCLWLIGGVSTAQAAHTHGQWLPHQSMELSAPSSASQAPIGDEHCPLCVAMHSALPVSTSDVPLQTVQVVCRIRQMSDRVPITTWHYAMFSRPPPVVGNV